MAVKTQAEILKFYEDLSSGSDSKSLQNFRAFLEQLFCERDLPGCVFGTSHATLCISRYPPIESRHKPLLCLSMASTVAVRIQFRITRAAKPALRLVTESSNAPYDIALDEFDRLYEQFLAAHE